jgi:predicted lipid-binding transport protein (Tim44 family)
VGGGHSYSGGGGGGGGGGSSSGYSSGSGGGGDVIAELLFQLFRALFYLTINAPIIGIPLDLLIIFAVYKFLSRDREFTISSSSQVPGLLSATPPARVNVSENIRALQQELDPEFSRPLFNDFCYALFAEVHKTRGDGKLRELSSYVSPEVMNGLEALSPGVKKVEGIVIGAMTIDRVTRVAGPQMRITVEFQSNYTETGSGGARQSWYTTERWTFVRASDAKSRPPETIRQITCPSCGAPPANDGQNRCPSCGNSNLSGRLAWFLENRNASREERPPLLTETVPEVGTGYPTLYDPDLKSEEAELFKAQPDFNWQKFEARARTIFLELQKAWSERRWERARPFETDAVFQTHSYWMNEYRKQNLINVLKDVQIGRIVPARIQEDKFYSAITLRIFAQMRDTTVSEKTGRVVAGSETPRAFSEYWTFIRGRGTGARAKAKAMGNDLACPACGAELKISQAGACEFCGAKITSGEFDWVLSMIEQDEAYSG